MSSASLAVAPRTHPDRTRIAAISAALALNLAALVLASQRARAGAGRLALPAGGAERAARARVGPRAGELQPAPAVTKWPRQPTGWHAGRPVSCRGSGARLTQL